MYATRFALIKKRKKVVHGLLKVVYLPIYQIIKYMNNFESNYGKISEILKTITKKEQFLQQKKFLFEKTKRIIKHILLFFRNKKKTNRNAIFSTLRPIL